MSKGLIVVPHTDHFNHRFVVAWTELLFHSRNLVDQLDFRFVGSSLIYEAREDAAQHCLDKGYDWLFFLDSDMEPRPDTIQRLLAHNVPIVSAMAFKRIQPYSPCFYPRVEFDGEKATLEIAEDWDEGLIEIQGVGMACCLIKREVFETSPKPWFFPMPVLAEDLGFCKRSRDAGHKIYVDTSICAGHISSEVITDQHYKMYRRLYK